MEGAGSLVFLALFLVAMWLLLIRPQRKRQQQLMQVQHSVEVGDEVMLSAGVFARVTAEVEDPATGDCLMVEVAPGVEMKIARGAVLRVVEPPFEAEESELTGGIDETSDDDPRGSS